MQAPNRARAALSIAALCAIPAFARAQTPPAGPPTDTTRRATPARAPGDSLRATSTRAHLSRSLRVCAGGDVTLGTNLDAGWARLAKRTMRERFGISDLPDTLLAPLRP